MHTRHVSGIAIPYSKAHDQLSRGYFVHTGPFAILECGASNALVTLRSFCVTYTQDMHRYNVRASTCLIEIIQIYYTTVARLWRPYFVPIRHTHLLSREGGCGITPLDGKTSSTQKLGWRARLRIRKTRRPKFTW